MAKKTFSNNIKGGLFIDKEPFLISSAEFDSSNKSNYFMVTLDDCKGRCYGIVKEDNFKEIMQTYKGMVCYIEGIVTYFHMRETIDIKSITPVVDFSEIDKTDLVRGITEEEKKRSISIIKGAIATIKDKEYSRLCTEILTDAELTSMGNFPSSLSRQAIYSGGALIETASLISMADTVLIGYNSNRPKIYEDVEPIDRDLLISSILLINVGKRNEYTDFPFKRTLAHCYRDRFSMIDQTITYHASKLEIQSICLNRLYSVWSSVFKTETKPVRREGEVFKSLFFMYSMCDQFDNAMEELYTKNVHSEAPIYSVKLSRYVELCYKSEDKRGDNQ